MTQPPLLRTRQPGPPPRPLWPRPSSTRSSARRRRRRSGIPQPTVRGRRSPGRRPPSGPKTSAPGSSASASASRTGWRSPPRPGSSGSSPTSAVLLAGAATTTVYPNTRPDDVSFILSDSGSTVVVAEDAAQLAKVADHRDELPGRPRGRRDRRHRGSTSTGSDGWILTLEDLAERGRALLARGPRDARRARRPAHPGHAPDADLHVGHDRPAQGRRADPRNWLYIAEASERIQVLTPQHLQFLWLPLAHVFAKLLVAAQLRIGFATAVDGRIDKIVENLAVIRPTFMAAAPRIFEKVYARVTTTAHAEGGAEGEDLRLGVRGRHGGRPQRAGRRVGPAAPRRPASASPTGWSSARSGPGSAAGSRCSCRAAPRSRRRSPSGSRPLGCRSARATA